MATPYNTPDEPAVEGSIPVVGSVIETVRPHAHWGIRLAFAGVFLFHGLTKLADVGAFVSMMGLPAFLAWGVALAEIAGGALVLVGGLDRAWATRLAGLVTAPVMIGAVATVHWPRWSFVATDAHPMGGMEFQVLLLALAAYLIVRGDDL